MVQSNGKRHWFIDVHTRDQKQWQEHASMYFFSRTKQTTFPIHTSICAYIKAIEHTHENNQRLIYA